MRLRTGYKWTIRRNNAVVLKEGKLDLSSGKDKIEIAGDQPEMIYVAIEPMAKLAADAPATRRDGGRPRQASTPAAATPTALPEAIPAATTDSTPSAPPSLPRRSGSRHRVRPTSIRSGPANWPRRRRFPINPVLTPVEADVPGVEMSTFVLDALGSHAQGYIAKPAKEGKFPALILLQYAGVYALNAHSVASARRRGLAGDRRRFARQTAVRPSGNIPRNYAAVGNTDRETSYFLNMYLRDSRALDYLMTRPDWDGKTIVLMGTSMGGQQSLMLAGLRPEKITAVLVCVPAGADTNGDLHGRKAGYPNWPSNDPKVMNTALYFDPINFASRIKAPVLAAMGFIDTISPPAGIWTALNQIPVPKEPLPMIESEHNNLTPQKEQNWDARSKEVLGILLNGGEFKPTN